MLTLQPSPLSIFKRITDTLKIFAVLTAAWIAGGALLLTALTAALFFEAWILRMLA